MTYDRDDGPENRPLSPLYNTRSGLMTSSDREILKALDAGCVIFYPTRREAPGLRKRPGIKTL